jgi:hypothetical protein
MVDSYHQQYLAKNPMGYCGRERGGVLLGSASVVVDVAAVPERDDNDQEDVVDDGVDDPVVADSHPIARSASQTPRGRWTRILGQECDRCPDAGFDVTVELS